MSLDVSVLEKSSMKNETTRLPFQVEIKNRTNPQRQEIFMCVETVYLEAKEYVDLKFAFELNELSGFDKMIINNNSIVNTPEFAKLFSDKKSLVDVAQYSDLPNLFKLEIPQTYLHHIEDLSIKGGEWSGGTIQFMYMDEFINTECLHRNVDKANLILVGDNDETLIAPKLTKFERRQDVQHLLTERSLGIEESVKEFQKEFLTPDKCLNTNLRSFIDSLVKEFKIGKEMSLYFPQVHYLKADLIEEIFSKLELSLKNLTSDFKFLTDSVIKVAIFKKHDDAASHGFSFKSSSYDANFNILIRNSNELKYAQSMLGVYTYLIRPFLKQNSAYFSQESNRASRFLYMDVLHPENIGYLGKTFVNSMSSDTMDGPHKPYGPLVGVDQFDTYTLAHFRNRVALGSADKPITRFNLDLNFFNCYVRPIIEKSRVRELNI